VDARSVPGDGHDDLAGRRGSTAGVMTNTIFPSGAGRGRARGLLTELKKGRLMEKSHRVAALSLAVALAAAGAVFAVPFSGVLLEDFNRFPYLWRSSPNVSLDNPQIASGDPLALPGQGLSERVLRVTAPLRIVAQVQGTLCKGGNGVVPVLVPTTPSFDATTIDHRTVTFGSAREAHVDEHGVPRRHVEDADGDGDLDLVFHFRAGDTDVPCASTATPLNGRTFAGQFVSAGGAAASFGRQLTVGQDWSAADGLRFWYYGRNTGDAITVELLDNRAPDPGPAGWTLAWSDEFDGPAGRPPNAAHWTPEIGDGTANGIPGWGNQELEYYTGDTANAAMDGAGHLAITARAADGSLACYYGPCLYTSARLISQHKVEFGYGRVEARLKVPAGAGLWPAFWSLGSTIGAVGWPQTGEIDVMEFVGREPNEIFGTIHGPGYSGGASFGGTYDFGTGAFNAFHTVAIEWQPDRIDWFVDGVLYHSATPADVAPNPWVFDHSFFLLLNLAVGGNFGGPVGPDTVFPATLLVDYVRVYRGPDTSERFEAAFTDSFSGWQEVVLPFSGFTRGATQPAGAPDDGLTLSDVWGYTFRLPDNGLTTGSLLLDGIGLVKPAAAVVTNAANAGPGSLRRAVDVVADNGLVTFDPSLAGATIPLAGPLVISGKAVTVDALAAPGVRLSGGGSDRIAIIDPGARLNLRHLTITDGYGFELAGGVLNNGTLDMAHCVVTNNLVTTSGVDFWKGGAGIYNGGGSTFRLAHSTVSDNTTTGADGGGVYAFFGATVEIDDSTLSGNVASNVGGGIRMLGNATLRNSTLSGNSSLAWHGSAIFHTDGVMNLVNTTVTGNAAPPGTAAVFVGTFTPASATLNIVNSIVAGNNDAGCILAPFGAGVVALNSLGNNVFSDASCLPVGSDLIVADALLGPLADNGGPTLTHLPAPGSPVVDAANAALCPAADQRGVSRPQGAGCDAGAVERQP
jgi:beta-glucanase (GH16 family)